MSIRGRVSRRSFLHQAGIAASGAAAGIAFPRLVFAQNKKAVKFTLAWVAEGSNLFAFVAKGMGFWEKHGLDVDIARGSGTIAAAQAIGAGSFDFGICATAGTILQSAKGLPLIQIATCAYDATMGIAVLNDSGIKTPKDLEGKQMGCTVTSGEYPFLPVFAERAGFDLKKVTINQVDNKVRDRLLAEKKVDAISCFGSSAMPSYVATGVKAHCMLYSKYGITNYGNCLMTQPNRVAAEPELCAAVTAGLLEGLKATLLDPAEAMKVFFKQVPEMALAGQAREQIRVGTGILTFVNVRPPMQEHGVGYTVPQDMTAMNDLVMKYVAHQGDKRPDDTALFTNKFVGGLKMSPAEWDQASKNAAEFGAYVS
ncbi:MAG TPA: ABC transporter substrate-binding protein [Stellaceae bacterium]|nr:ABC transporter substrate-binding protein [Stellaceae bacterium]